MDRKESRTRLYVLLSLLGLVALAYIAQPRHWERRQSIPASLPPTAETGVPKQPPPKAAMDPKEAVRRARGMCSRIAKNADTLADYVGTGCKPSQGQNGIVDLVIVARNPVFYVSDAKKAWLLVIIGAVGKEMTDHPEVPIGEVVVSDPVLANQKSFWWFPGSLAKSLRNQIYAEQLTLDEAYLRLLEGMQQVR